MRLLVSRDAPAGWGNRPETGRRGVEKFMVVWFRCPIGVGWARWFEP